METRRPRRWLPIGVGAMLIFITLLYIHTSGTAAEAFKEIDSRVRPATSTVTVTAAEAFKDIISDSKVQPATSTVTVTSTADAATKPTFTPGTPDPDREYRKAIVVASIKSENTSWVGEQLPDVEPYIYVVDDPEAELTVPRNFGNELMPYLTFIIDHYDKLPDISIFVHAHEYTHLHNPAIFGYSTPAMIKALNPRRVIRDGYMNLNCGDWKPGQCTAHIRPVEEVPTKFHKAAWEALFPDYPLPSVLAGSCCSQFAVSRERIRQVPLAKWNHFRNWLLSLEEGYMKNPGFVWEFLWQWVLGGEHVYCPASHVCLCDGYDMCFGGEDKFDAYVRLEDARETMRQNIIAIDRAQREKEEAGKDRSGHDDARRENMIAVMSDLDLELSRLRDRARERGRDPKLREDDLR